MATRRVNMYKAAEVAEMLNVSVRTVKNLWTRGELMCCVSNCGHRGRYSTLEQVKRYARVYCCAQLMSD